MVYRCPLCDREIRQSEVAIRGIVEVVNEGESGENDLALRRNVHDWEMVFAYHLSCVIEASNTGKTYIGEDFCMEIDVETCQEELCVQRPRLASVKD